MEYAVLIIALVTLLAVLSTAALLLRRQRAQREALGDELEESLSLLRQELGHTVNASVGALGKMIGDNQLASAAQLEGRVKSFEAGNEQKLEAIRQTIERQLRHLQAENNQKLDEMRQIVDEKLQKTLESKMTQSFRLVNERLEQVYKGLGEMQTLAAGVGDLKKVLSNVKTRGILGEIQLGAILEEILSPEQYAVNAATRPGSRERVEYAVKLPAEDGQHVYLPIDAKFPGDLYGKLQDAYESGSVEGIQAAAAALTVQIKKEARDIRDKYIAPPHTTEFAILFLPFEGLYAEAVNRGLVEELQRSYRVNLAGPSTMAALLNSLQMGFKTFAIQKRSGEVWRVLGAVKTEFAKFESILSSSQKRLLQVNDDLDRLIGVRTRSIVRSLRGVEQLDEGSAERLLGAALELETADAVPGEDPAE
ncbi:MAG: DNA recombination protein RmuC [Clostridia bacterium]|nr:DNA recombination protein RmuC [Clostridia bacterium]